MTSALRPLVRELQILWFTWALRDMQRHNPHHPDMPEVVVALRDLMAERRACRGYGRRDLEWQ